MPIRRLLDRPIIVPNMDDRIGDNINGASLIRVPDWAPNRLGNYYLYFAHHQGTFIRMAWADSLEGPWTLHGPGVLDLSATEFSHHIASPDVHVDEAERRFRMYFHGCGSPARGLQRTCVSTSADGLGFVVQHAHLGFSYWRVWYYDGWYYTLEMPGIIRRTRDPLATAWELGPVRFTEHMRHSAVRLDGHTLTILWSNAYDAPERILMCTMDLRGHWHHWTPSEPQELLRAERPWEGGDLPPEPSKRGSVHHPVNQLRDPCLFRDVDGRDYLLYSVAGEYGIAIAEWTAG